MRKIISLLTLLSLLIGLGAANHYTFPEITAEYGDTVAASIQCDGPNWACTDSFSSEYILEVCGDEADRIRGSFGATSPTDSYEFNFKVPEDADCGTGDHEFTFIPGTSQMHEASGGTLTVESNPNYLENFEMAYNNVGFGAADEMRGLGLTNSPYRGADVDYGPGDLIYTWSGTGGNVETVSYNTEPGTIVSPGDKPKDFLGSQTPSEAFVDTDRAIGDYKQQIETHSPQSDTFHRDIDTQPRESKCNGDYSCSASYYEEDAKQTGGYAPGVEPIYRDMYYWDLKADVLVLDDGFHLCAESEHGAIRDAGGESYECTSTSSSYSEGQWVKYEEPCPAGQVGKNENDEVVAYYEQGGDCKQDTIFEWSWASEDDDGDGTPEYAPRTVNEPNVDTCGVGSDGGLDCPNNIPTTDIPVSVDESQWIEAGEVPVVEYGAYKDHFEALINNSNGPTAETGFVDPDLGWTTQHQVLHTAEKKYDASGRTDSCNQCLNPDWWNGLNMTIGLEGNNLGYWNTESAEKHYVERHDDTSYAGSDEELDIYDTPWYTANAGYQDVAVDDDSSEFKGGFAGNCQGEQTWTYVGDGNLPGEADWECGGAVGTASSGSVTGNSVTILPDLTTTAYLPQPDTSSGEMTVGITLFPFNNQPESERPDYLPEELSNQVSYYGDVSQSGASNPEIQSATVACWSGTLSDKPGDVTSSSRAFYRTGINLGTSSPVTETGTVDAGDYTGYACQWEYEVSDYSDPVKGEAEDVIALHTRENRQYLEDMRDANADIPE